MHTRIVVGTLCLRNICKNENIEYFLFVGGLYEVTALRENDPKRVEYDDCDVYYERGRRPK